MSLANLSNETIRLSMDQTSEKKVILAVDDEELTRDVLVQALRILGYEAVAASNGADALNLFESCKPSAIITDIHMPEMDGLELLRHVRDKDKALPVILITGYDAGEARLAAESYGASALLIKPFRIHELQEILVKLFSQ